MGRNDLLIRTFLRAKRRDILKSIQITDIGDKDAVRQAVEVFKKAGLNVIAVRDADVGENIKDDLFSFPGNRPPEVEVFQHEEVKKFLYKEYHIDFDWLIKKEGISDHHNYTQAIAKEAECEEEVIRTLAIKKYIEIIDEKFDPLITNIVSKIK